MNLLRYLILFSFIIQMIACGGAEERKAAYMEKAEQSLQAGDLDKARIELKNVLQIDPKDAAAFYKLGNIYERQKEYNKAFANYSKAEELESGNPEYIAKIGRFYLVLAGDIEKAKEKLALIQTIDKDDINGLLLQAGILLKEDKGDEAIHISQGIFESHPDNIENSLFLATLYSRDDQYNKAIETLDKTLQFNPDNPSLMNMLGTALFSSKDYTKAESTFKSILDKHPEVFDNHARLALFYQKTDQSDRAEEVLRSAVELDKEDMKRRLALIKYIQETKGNQEAIAELNKEIKGSTNLGDLRLVLGELQVKENQLNDAIETYKNAVKDYSSAETGIKARIALAIIYMQQKKVDSAQSIINDAAEISPNDADVNLVKAKIAIYNKNYDQAIISLRTVIKDAPDNIEAYFLLAGAHKANNESQQADEIIAKAYENNRTNARALLPLAKYFTQINKIHDAENAIDDYLKLDANNYEALSIKSGILNNKKEYKDASDVAEKLINLYPDKENGYIQAVPNLLASKNVQGAIDLLESGYEKTNKNQTVLVLLSEVEINYGKADSAIKRLKTAISSKDNEQLSLLLAKAYSSIKDNDSVKSTLQESIKSNPENIQSYLSLANVYFNEKKTDKAVSVLIDGGNANKQDIKTRILLATIYEQTGAINDAIEVYEQILLIDKNNLISINNLAALLSEYKTDTSINRALELAEKLKSDTRPVIKDTVGWIYYKAGKLDEAARILSEVVEASPEINVFNYHLGMAYFKAGNLAEAKKYLEKATSTDAKFAGRDIAEKTLKNM